MASHVFNATHYLKKQVRQNEDFRHLPSKFLKVADLQSKPLEAVIREVRIEPVGMDGDEKPVLYFRNKTKAFVLNKTNALAICARYGDVLDDWAGRPIILYPARTPFQGKVVDCIRVRLPEAADGESDGESVPL